MFTGSITKHVSVSITRTALPVLLTPHCHPVPLRARGLIGSLQGGSRVQTQTSGNRESLKNRQKIVSLEFMGKLSASQMSMRSLVFVDDLYVDKGHKMKHYSKFYSLENILSANAWWEINLYLFPYLRKST
ncbi:hypothetical protein HJG60_008269 [Phyllostomus discolor]|uniref:Uncharacterized protein n=1 Tax=Phyllostomus discolor TaxID=89673 RepID=A0A834DQI4_9CHIR|nr:hypothetical protein HJG60_008269 [Phyllostomus discolor]